MNITNIRKLRGLTQVDLAELIGTTQPTISRAERGDGGVTLDVFRACADALGVPLHELFADDRTKAESLLLESFRRLSPERQKGWIDLARQAAEDRPKSDL